MDAEHSVEPDDTDALESRALVGSVYKSIRWVLCELLLRLGNEDDGDPSVLPRLLDDVESALYLLERYMDHEERRLYPIVMDTAPAAVQPLTLQHQQQARDIARMREFARRAESKERSDGSELDRLYLEFSNFVANSLLHLYEEEALTTRTLLLVHGRAFIANVQSSLINDMGPDERALFRRALLPSTRPTWRKRVGLGR